MENKLLEGLNDAQKEAVQFMDGPLLVLAGPGSGKTRVVTHRVAWMLEHGVYGGRIAALTFTNKAADEMRARLDALSPGSRVWIGTFHRFCAWLLRNYIEYSPLAPNFTIYDTDESRRLVEGLVDKRNLPSGVDAGKILSAISWAKNALVLPDDYQPKEEHALGKIVEKVYPDYQEALRRANAVDFDDLLVHVALLLKRNPEVRARLDDRYRYILVDEYQDTNFVQYAIARALSVDFPNLAVTGDPDQSIYGWRGANIKNILDFEKDFQNAKVIRLEENYRSTKKILAVAQGLIQHNRLRKEKELYTSNPEGARPRLLRCYNHTEEADVIAREIAEELAAGRRSPRDYAIFFRMNALSRNLEHALRRRGVPFQLVRGLEFFNRKEVKDLIAYLQLIHNPSDTISFLRVVNLPVRGIGRVSIERLREFADERGLSLIDAARRVGQISRIPMKAVKSIAAFVAMIDRLAETAVDSDLEIVVSLLLKETRYTAAMEVSDSEEEKQRLANVQELLSEVREFDKMYNEEQSKEETDPTTLLENPFAQQSRLGRFLEQAALVSDVDGWEDSDRVSLMTLHAAKGLEFPVVYIIALEDNILPHERSIYDKNQLEEERRLLFVGITRAKEEVRLSRTEFREYRGNYSSSMLSRFLFELPKEEIEVADTRTLFPEGVSEPAAAVPSGGEEPLYLSDYLRQTGAGGDSDGSDSEEEIEGGGVRIVYEDRPKRGKKSGRAANPRAKKPAAEGVHLETDEYCDLPPEGETEVVFDENGDVVAPPRKKSAMKKQRPIAPDAVRFGRPAESGPNEIASDEKQKAIRPGVLVRHADFGVGVVKFLEGPASDRIATVEFLSGVGAVQVALNDVRLSPVKKSS